uniref:Uncharacterized protein n=1 Tax=Arundo donax TaxID=35708 RepID=A0A0A9EMZ8_ARUDO
MLGCCLMLSVTKATFASIV